MPEYKQVKINQEQSQDLHGIRIWARGKMKATGYQTDMRTPEQLTDTHQRGQQANMRTASKTEEPNIPISTSGPQ